TRYLESFSYEMINGTDIAAGLEQSVTLLEQAPARPGLDLRRYVLLLTDGDIEVPGVTEPDFPEYLRAAPTHARAAGVRIVTFGVGVRLELYAQVLRSIARETGGRYVPVRAVPDLPFEMLLLSFASLSDVELRNNTNGAGARGTRVFPDGS